jgi:hypothetical protein
VGRHGRIEGQIVPGYHGWRGHLLFRERQIIIEIQAFDIAFDRSLLVDKDGTIVAKKVGAFLSTESLEKEFIIPAFGKDRP